MDKGKTLIIWLKDGTTCKFEQVEKFWPGKDTLEFEYFGVATQVKRKAEFLKSGISGYALEI